MVDIKKTIKLIADLCHNWGFARYQSAFLGLVDALKEKKYDVSYTCNKVKKSGALEIYLDKEGKKHLVFSKISTGNWFDEEQIESTIEMIEELEE